MASLQESHSTRKHTRKRKAHRKSRSGCANCKLRRVKCDEAFPECRECRSFDVCCNYDLRIPDLQPRSALNHKLNGSKMQPSYKILVTDFTAEESKLELTGDNLSRLQRFKLRTALSLGPPAVTELYENEVYRLMFRYPFLMHFAQTLTSIHDRYLSPTPGRRTTDEMHHWTKGVTLFNKRLSAPIHPADRDAIWAAASMLGVITFASIELPTPEEKTWPLAPSLKVEPEWLKMGQGKSALLPLVQPDRPESIFHAMFSSLPTIEFALENVPPEFIALCDLDKALSAGGSSSSNCSPYAVPAAIVFAALDTECSWSAVVLFYAFNGCMHNEFGHLVVDKDPRALLLMAYWYSKICTGEWWLRKRALMEGRATCMYLERYCADIVAIQELLDVPRQVLCNYALWNVY